MIRVTYTPRLQRELEQIVDTIAVDNAPAADRFVAELDIFAPCSQRHLRWALCVRTWAGMFAPSVWETISSSIAGIPMRTKSIFCQ